VQDPKLGSSIQEALKIPCRTSDVVNELCRGARTHFSHLIKGLTAENLSEASRSLGHAYSRGKIMFNVNRQDNMIIQAVQLLDQMDKDVNTSSMRVREWYGWHFPELAKIASDPYLYARLVRVIGNRSESCIHAASEEEILGKLDAVTNDPDVSKRILSAATTSMGIDVSKTDMLNISMFAERVEALAKYRHELNQYLGDKMHEVAPNLDALLGELVGARLIAHAGSLTKLSKLPASTVQILGAEKALFRALKTKGNTPKFGLLYNSSYISRADMKNKGKISRVLANKCSIASRIDSFSDETPSAAYGLSLKSQLEERLEYFRTGAKPKKNVEVMRQVKQQLSATTGAAAAAAAAGGQSKKRKLPASSKDADVESDDGQDAGITLMADNKKKKKARQDDGGAAAAVAAAPVRGGKGDDDGGEESPEERAARKKAKKAAKAAAKAKSGGAVDDE
jgi:nucleolar protein 56